MGLMLSVLIFCVGVIEAIAWTKYLRDTCTPCYYHRRVRSKRLWTSRKSFNKMGSNSEEYALHHEAKCVCSDVHKVDISWPRSFSPDVCIKEGHGDAIVEETTTENCNGNVSTAPLHSTSNGFQTLVKRNSNESQDSIDEMEEIGFKDEPLPPLVRQRSEDSWSAKKRSDSENSIEDFDGLKTSKVNICWPRPFTPEDLRVIKKRNRTDSERSVDEAEEAFGETRVVKPTTVLRVIKSRSPSDSEETDSGEGAERVIDNKNDNTDCDITDCRAEGTRHDGDTEVSSIFIKPECKLELKRDSCVPEKYGHLSDMAVVNNAVLTGTYSGLLPEIPENDVSVSDVSEGDGVRENLINSTSDSSSELAVDETYESADYSSFQHRDRVIEYEPERNDEANVNDTAAYRDAKPENCIAENDNRLPVDSKTNDSSAILGNDNVDSKTPEEGLKPSAESDGTTSDKDASTSFATDLPITDRQVSKTETYLTSVEDNGTHSSVGYESLVQENRSAQNDAYEESSDSDVVSPVSLEVHTDNSGNNSLYNNYNSSRTSETLDEVSEISEKDFKESSENSNRLVNVMATDVSRILPEEEEFNGALTDQPDNHRSGDDVPLGSENTENDDVQKDSFSSQCDVPEIIEDDVGDPGSNVNYDILTDATEDDDGGEHSEISGKEYFSVCDASECFRAESDVSSSYCGNDTRQSDGSVYLCKAKETEEPNFEGSVRVCESDTVVLNAVAPPELGEQPNDDVQTLDNKEVRGSEDVPSESSAPRNENVKATEELVKTPVQSEIDKSFWLIFSGEYTKAMSKDWHSGHFCCWQCDESLTGQRYVLRDDHPYCVKCYESVFANGCEECSKIIGIDSKDLSYKDKHWHEACFLCNKCRVSLVDKQFGSKVDKIYCGNCYDQQFASRCDGCSQVFRAGTKKMEYKTRQWHEPCFCCCVCKTPIGTKSFIPREQEIYCATCYEEKFATRCVKCSKIITSGGVTYKNEPWHRECFTCTNCNTSLAGQRFTSRDEKPYCADCFGELFAKRCTACCKPITGIGGTRFISFEDRHWHNDCFICASCKTSLVGRGFITDGDDIICPDCAKQKLM